MSEKIYFPESVPMERTSPEERQRFDALEVFLGSATFLGDGKNEAQGERIRHMAERYYHAMSVVPDEEYDVAEFVSAEDSFQGALNHLVGGGQMTEDECRTILDEIKGAAQRTYDRSQETDGGSDVSVQL